MAECVRVPFLLLFAFIAVNVCPIRGDNAGFKAVGNDVINPPVRPGAPAEADRSPVVRAGGPAEADRSPVVGAGGPVEADRSPVVGASPPRRHSAPWKLAEEAACRDDLSRLCPKHSWNNNLAVLECLQDRKEVRRTGLSPGPVLSLGYKQGPLHPEAVGLLTTTEPGFRVEPHSGLWTGGSALLEPHPDGG